MLISALLLAVAAPAQPVMLWNGLQAGMSKAEVKAAQPKRTVDIGSRCMATFVPRFDDGKLDRIHVENAGQYDREIDCQEMVRANLTAKYGAGEPRDPSIDCKFDENLQCSFGNLGSFGSSLLAQKLRRDDADAKYDYMAFRRDGVEVLARFKREHCCDFSLVYTTYTAPVISDAVKL